MELERSHRQHAAVFFEVKPNLCREDGRIKWLFVWYKELRVLKTSLGSFQTHFMLFTGPTGPELRPITFIPGALNADVIFLFLFKSVSIIQNNMFGASSDPSSFLNVHLKKVLQLFFNHSGKLGAQAGKMMWLLHIWGKNCDWIFQDFFSPQLLFTWWSDGVVTRSRTYWRSLFCALRYNFVNWMLCKINCACSGTNPDSP